MASVESSIAIQAPDQGSDLPEQESSGKAVLNQEFGQLLSTFLSTMAVFAIFLGQGIMVARILGPVGRGEFGTAVFFPRDILLYVGLLGGIEIVTRYAASPTAHSNRLKYAAVSLGLFSGVLTGLLGAILAAVVLLTVNGGQKAYLLPYALLVCLFVPWEHIHLNVAAVDRGRQDYFRYNLNRVLFALAFPLLLLVLLIPGATAWFGGNLLLIACCLFVLARIIGLFPTLRGLKFSEWMSGISNKPSDDETGTPSTVNLLREGVPYGLSMFATELFERLDILLILALASIEQSGFYFVAIPAAALLTVAPNSLGVFTFNAGATNRKISVGTASTVMLVTALFQVVSLWIFWLIIPSLIVLVYGEPFRPAIAFVWYLLPAFAIKGFLQAADGYLKGCGKPLVGVWARFISIFVMLLFVYLTFAKFELISIPMAACVAQAVSMAIVVVFVIRETANRVRVEGSSA